MRIEMFTERSAKELAESCWGDGPCPAGKSFNCPFDFPFDRDNKPCWAVTEEMWAALELRYVDVADGFCLICRFADENAECAYAGPGEKPCRKKLGEEWSEEARLIRLKPGFTPADLADMCNAPGTACTVGHGCSCPLPLGDDGCTPCGKVTPEMWRPWKS